MDIVFESSKFEEECNNQRLLVKKHGADRAKRIQKRLNSLIYANVLEDMRNVPGRCHELLHDHAGKLALDLDHPYRLIFEPADEPIPTKFRWWSRLESSNCRENNRRGGLSWKVRSKIGTIQIMFILLGILC